MLQKEAHMEGESRDKLENSQHFKHIISHQTPKKVGRKRPNFSQCSFSIRIKAHRALRRISVRLIRKLTPIDC